MSHTTEDIKQVPGRGWVKMAMVISVLIFGLIVPSILNPEANNEPLLIATGFGTIPIFLIFILVRNELWTIPFDSGHKKTI